MTNERHEVFRAGGKMLLAARLRRYNVQCAMATLTSRHKTIFHPGSRVAVRSQYGRHNLMTGPSSWSRRLRAQSVNPTKRRDIIICDEAGAMQGDCQTQTTDQSRLELSRIEAASAACPSRLASISSDFSAYYLHPERSRAATVVKGVAKWASACQAVTKAARQDGPLAYHITPY